MSPVRSRSPPVIPRFPRVSGDEPKADNLQDLCDAFSPRERG